MIIITTYHNRKNDHRFFNRRKYLEETIRSVDNQKVENIFHLIIDDGSTDDTYDVLHAKYATSNRRRVIRRNKGDDEVLTSTNARNFGINLCLESNFIEDIDISEHEYITFIDSDDILIDLSARLNYAMKERCDFLYTDALLFFDDTDIAFKWNGIRSDLAYKNLWIYGKMPYPTMTWKVSFLRKLKQWTREKYNFDGPFDPHIGCGEDVDIALSSFECARYRGCKVGYLPKITAGYRIHNFSLATIRNQDKRSNEENTVLRRHYGNSTSHYLHLRRFVARPECYIPSLMIFKNLFRRRLSKSQFLH